MTRVIIILLFIFLLAGGAWFIFQADEESILPETLSLENDDDDDDDDASANEVNSRQQLVQGSLTVRLSTETQKLAGIETVNAEEITLDSEDQAFASVIDIQGLVDLRSQYRNVQAQRKISNTALSNSSKTLRQLEQLHSEATNISQRELQQARATRDQDRARVSAADIKLQNIRDEMLQRWNTTLTDLALKNDSEIFRRLIRQDELVILLSLRADQELLQDTAFVFVNRNEERRTARKAYLISAAPFSDTTLRGETYFLRVPAEKLRIGMRLHVWLPNTGFSGSGIGIPDEAIVWYAGKAWAYVQVDDETFSRRSLPESMNTGSGWLVTDNFEVGDKLVISGAQTLLSEEFKWAIPDEDDD